jgi:hypothetical protein
MPDTPVTDGVGIIPDGNPSALITAADFSKDGELKMVDKDLALVVQSANLAKAFIANKQWTLLWRDAD